MNKSFTKDDLHSGYVAVLRDGRKFMVMRVGQFTKILTDGLNWTYLNSGWTEELRGKNYVARNDYLRPYVEFDPSEDIVAVYGLVTDTTKYGIAALATDSLCARKCLWRRSEPKKMTVADICKALGYDVEVVKEEST